MLCNIKKEKEKPQQIQVFVRSRPLNQQERDSRSTSCIDIIGSKELSIKQQHGKKYYFDRVFGPTTKQLEVYMSVVNPLIYEVLAGYNCTIFAYGQTGTGKTHTMAGGSDSNSPISWENDESAGIIPRAMAHLFEELQVIQQEYTVRVAYLELYNEELYDLLAEGDEFARIRLFEDQHQKGSVIIQGIEQMTVVNINQVYEILERGQEKRRTASTLMNTQSSRSHTVFTITVHTRETTVEGDVLVKTGKLNLVDLAGSENISRSGAVEKRAREAGSINQSLLTLGRVIKSLVERSGHIPYRESKLTRILQDSLGGRTKTSIIATISPAFCNLEETMSTLEYANRARNITNRPEINQRMSQKAAIAQYCDEIERLRKDLQAARTGTGIYVSTENYEQLVVDSEHSKEVLAAKVNIIRELEIQLKTLEDQKDILELNWREMRTSFDATNRELNEHKVLLQQTTIEKNEQEYLATCFEERAKKLYDQSQVLLNVTKTSKVVDAALRDKIKGLYSTAQENYEATKSTSMRIYSKCDEMLTDLKKRTETFNNTSNSLDTICEKVKMGHHQQLEMAQSFTDNILKEVRKFEVTFNDQVASDKVNMTELLEQFVISCKNHVENIDKAEYKDICQSMKNNIQTHTEEQTNLGEALKTQILNRHESNVSAYKSIASDFDEDEQKLLSNISNLEGSVLHQQSDNEEIQEQITYSQQNLKKMFQLHKEQNQLMNSLIENFITLQTSVDSSKTLGITNLTTIGDTQKCLTEVSKKVKAKTELNIQEEGHTLMDLLNTNRKMNTDRGEFEKKQLVIIDAIETNCEVTQSCIKEALTENVETFKEELCNHQNNVEKNQTQAVKMLNKDLNISMEERNIEIKTSVSKLKTYLDELLMQFEENTMNEKQYESALANNLQECQDCLSTFTNVKLKEIKPSGETPVRTQYAIPVNLKAPTPKERILFKFQERLQLINNINECDDKMETPEQQGLAGLCDGIIVSSPNSSGDKENCI